jgi:hypothetical protein
MHVLLEHFSNFQGSPKHSRGLKIEVGRLTSSMCSYCRFSMSYMATFHFWHHNLCSFAHPNFLLDARITSVSWRTNTWRFTSISARADLASSCSWLLFFPPFPFQPSPFFPFHLPPKLDLCYSNGWVRFCCHIEEGAESYLPSGSHRQPVRCRAIRSRQSWRLICRRPRETHAAGTRRHRRLRMAPTATTRGGGAAPLKD